MFRNKKKEQTACAGPLPVINLPHTYIVQENEYRPCYVHGQKALFHRWANSARPQLPKGVEPGENARYYQFRTTHGIVEYEDGTVDLAWPRDIKFADGGHFKDYAWLPYYRADEGTK